MEKRVLILVALGAAATVSSIPSIASAQSYGIYIGSGNGGYYDDDGQREAWVAHERHEQHERWEQEQARRRYWQHERWERERSRRNWDGDRWEHRRYEDRDD